MRWYNLFHDLEAQLESEGGFVQADVERDELRRRRADQSLLHTLEQHWRAGVNGRNLELWTEREHLWISVDNWGRDWIAGEITQPAALAGFAVLNTACITAVRAPESGVDVEESPSGAVLSTLAGGPSAQQAHAPKALITLRIVLRDLARRRKLGSLHSAGRVITGRLERVGSDFLEMTPQSATVEARYAPQTRGFYIPLSRVEFFRLDD